MKSTILIALDILPTAKAGGFSRILGEYGPANVLEFAKHELQNLTPGMARVEVRAAGINPIDARRMTGEFKHTALPQAFGTEFSRRKAKDKLARLHARIGNIREDALHQFTTDLTRRYHTLGIEDLNVRGMLGNRHLARAIADMSFFEFRRQLDYKAQMRGGLVVVADRLFASSKTCSNCGHKLDALSLSVRNWTCPACGTHHDRDVKPQST